MIDTIDFVIGLGMPSSIDEVLLLQACTHKSFSADNIEQQIPHNERLEFLGDSILGACVAHALYEMHPEAPESRLTLAKIRLVQEGMLATIARNIGLGKHIRLGNGEERSGGRDKDAILADALEALIAYIYVDHGRESVASFINNHIMTELANLDDLPGKSRKSLLQELVQKRWQALPIYEDSEKEVEASGNVLSYTSQIYVQGKLVAEAFGPSKKKAQELAAEQAYAQLQG